MLFCRGIGRKLAVPVLVFSVLGWILYVIGFAGFNNTDNYYNAHRGNGTNDLKISPDRGYFLREDGTLPAQRADLLWFPHWCLLILGPFVYICSAIHLIVGRFFTGIFTKFLTAVYLAIGGAVTYSTGVFLFSDTRSGMEYVLDDQVRDVPDWISDPKFGLWHVLEFAGACGVLIFMTAFMMMWPLFSERYEEYEEYEEEKQQEDSV